VAMLIGVAAVPVGAHVLALRCQWVQLAK